jgi:hypothetical protein
MEEETTCSILTEPQYDPFLTMNAAVEQRVFLGGEPAALRQIRYACSSSRRYSLGEGRDAAVESRTGVKYPSQFICWAVVWTTTNKSENQDTAIVGIATPATIFFKKIVNYTYLPILLLWVSSSAFCQ